MSQFVIITLIAIALANIAFAQESDQQVNAICPQWVVIHNNMFGNCGCESAINTQYTNNDPDNIVSATCGNFVPFQCYQVVNAPTQWVCGKCSGKCKGTQVTVQINNYTTENVVACNACWEVYLPL